jgi:hypothetical protein
VKKGDLVSELIAVLDETQSVDTFLVTLGLLESMEAKAQPAIPSILRNAERLGVFKNHLTSKGRDTEQVESIVKSLEKILSSEQKSSPRTAVAGSEPSEPGSALGALAGALVGSAVGSPAPFIVEAPCRLQPKPGSHELKLLIDCYGLPKEEDADDARDKLHTIAWQMRKHLQTRLAKDSLKLSFVPLAQIEALRKAKKTDTILTFAALATQFQPDYIIRVEVFEIATEGGGSDGRKRLSVPLRLSAHDVRKQEGDAIHEEICDIVHSTNGDVKNLPWLNFAQQGLEKVGRELAERFSVKEK